MKRISSIRSDSRHVRKNPRPRPIRINKIHYSSKDYHKDSGRACFDPFQQHVHNWKIGTIECAEKPNEKTFVTGIKRVPYTGNHCSICHLTRILPKSSSATSYMDKLNKGAKLLNSLEGFMYKKVIREKKVYRSVTDIRTIDTTETLFINKSFCKFFINKDSICGKIIRELKREKLNRVLLIEDDDGKEHTVYSKFVFPEYKIQNNPEKCSLFKIPPLLVSIRKNVTTNGKGKFWFTSHQTEWDQKWNFYKAWRDFQQFLKKWLPEEIDFYAFVEPEEKINNDYKHRMKKKENYEDSEEMFRFDRPMWTKYNISDENYYTKSCDRKKKCLKKPTIKLDPFPSFFMKPDYMPDTYFKFVDTEFGNEIDNDLKNNSSKIVQI